MQLNRHVVLLFVAVLMIGSATEAYGQKWKLISSTTATRKIRYHLAVIPKKHDGIRRIKLRALNAPIKVWDMTVHYRNGETQSVSLPSIIRMGGETPPIQLDERGGIRNITFNINAVTFSKKTAVIWIYGR